MNSAGVMRAALGPSVVQCLASGDMGGVQGLR